MKEAKGSPFGSVKFGRQSRKFFDAPAHPVHGAGFVAGSTADDARDVSDEVAKAFFAGLEGLLRFLLVGDVDQGADELNRLPEGVAHVDGFVADPAPGVLGGAQAPKGTPGSGCPRLLARGKEGLYVVFVNELAPGLGFEKEL